MIPSISPAGADARLSIRAEPAGADDSGLVEPGVVWLSPEFLNYLRLSRIRVMGRTRIRYEFAHETIIRMLGEPFKTEFGAYLMALKSMDISANPSKGQGAEIQKTKKKQK